MQPHPIEPILDDLIEKYGWELTQEANRLRNLLYDCCKNEHAKEIRVISWVAELKLVDKIRQSTQSIEWEGFINKVTSEYGVEPALAEWAISCWNYCLDARLPEVQYYLGLAHYTGEGRRKDDEKARTWLQSAAEQGHIEAQYLLGTMYAEGTMFAQDTVKAYFWLEQAGNKGHLKAQYTLGLAYEEQNMLGKSAEWYAAAAHAGHAKAICRLGEFYERGLGVKKDIVLAIALHNSAAEKGEVQALFNLGYLYDQGTEIPKNIQEAKAWYTKAADMGHRTAKEQLRKLNQNTEVKKTKQDIVIYFINVYLFSTKQEPAYSDDLRKAIRLQLELQSIFSDTKIQVNLLNSENTHADIYSNAITPDTNIIEMKIDNIIKKYFNQQLAMSWALHNPST